MCRIFGKVPGTYHPFHKWNRHDSQIEKGVQAAECGGAGWEKQGAWVIFPGTA